jgi:hypothetical protein
MKWTWNFQKKFVQKKVQIKNTFLLNRMMQKPTQEPSIGNENNDNPISFNKRFIKILMYIQVFCLTKIISYQCFRVNIFLY